MDSEEIFIFSLSLIFSLSFITMLATCLCCRRKVPKNELLGLEGMVKIKNPDESLNNLSATAVTVSVDPKSSGSDSDAKRASNAPHRSLPDIPVSDALADTNSELYATVGDKVHEKPQGRSPPSNFKNQASVSQHSSISQADDISSPYARVRTPTHAYDKVRTTADHPYAQLKAASSSSGAGGSNSSSQAPPVPRDDLTNGDTPSSRCNSNQSLLDISDRPQEIPAASAIAGRISASQELPYMTPPIVQPQQHFSGDSQDSSKGYTSISVREPLANILAQTNQQASQLRRNEISDSHYATVSDDSDEMYAAIDDRNQQQVDVYTSGSETYAQIQPAAAPPPPLTVAVEINAAPSSLRTIGEEGPSMSTSGGSDRPIPTLDEALVPPPVDSLRAAPMHSRQASSSSCTSSVGNLGSPKPEKRQANSPLPPTPKNSQYLSSNNLTSTSSIPSSRNSIASVIDMSLAGVAVPGVSRQLSRENLVNDGRSSLESATSTVRPDKSDSDKKKHSPSKDLEGMYAKVMKRNKLSSFSSQNSSPLPNRRSINHDSPVDLSASPETAAEPVFSYKIETASPKLDNNHKTTSQTTDAGDNNYESIDKRRHRHNSYEKDPGYETIPADKLSKASAKCDIGLSAAQQKSRLSAPAGLLALNEQHQLLQPADSRLLSPKTSSNNDPGYETVSGSSSAAAHQKKPNSDYDPNYEVLRTRTNTSSDDGYARVWEKPDKGDSSSDGYSSIQMVNEQRLEIAEKPGYSTIKENPPLPEPDYSSIKEKRNNKNHDYASIMEAKKMMTTFSNNNDESCDIYSSIPNDQNPSYLSIEETQHHHHNYSTISDFPLVAATTKTMTMATTPTTTTDTSPTNLPHSGYSSVSEIRTTPSTESNSSDTHIGYNSIRNTFDGAHISGSHNNCESLTESESDPNYESVKYTDVKENPYERLHNDPSPAAESGSSISPATSGTALKNGKPFKCSTDAVEVSDYFQV